MSRLGEFVNNIPVQIKPFVALAFAGGLLCLAIGLAPLGLAVKAIQKCKNK